VELSAHERKNRAFWDRFSAEYQGKHGAQLDWRRPGGWGVWHLPESELRVLGDVRDKDVLELGCGAAQWSIRLAKSGARVVALDTSAEQLAAASRLMVEAAVEFPLVLASAEHVPMPDAAFDVVFCDHGAMTFANPFHTIPEAARLLRAGGLLAFNMATPFLDMCWDERADTVGDRLQRDYFGLRYIESDNISYQLPYGDWVDLFVRNGFAIEALLELRPPKEAQTSYQEFVTLEWAQRWPAEHIWKVRKRG